ncbi:hypothetical protein K523DRAFT_338334 [Schizophyllum commune Tattone D]|nr:hypothetical protein K523DRAFT_338334 [Schizophyllum commune Tattone D]
MYLHEQLKLVGTEPVPLERVSTYRGLSSRSIRTLLVHMRSGVGKLSLRTESEEQKVCGPRFPTRTIADRRCSSSRAAMLCTARSLSLAPYTSTSGTSASPPRVK